MPSGNNFLITETIKIVVVKLSKTADKKNVINPIIKIKYIGLTSINFWVITSNPLWASINSTMVIAPIRKNKTLAISEI